MNYSKGSPRKDSGSSTLNCNQSLFMDESSEDLENYLNTPLPKNSSVGDGDEILYFEQEIECSTINALSKNIKGKFHRSSKDSKKNKFFKSKSSEEKPTVHSNEIPMINEAMKKILKDTPCKPQLKHSPKALKTYSNKHKDKSLVVESFGLPDEPFVSVDTSNLNEQDSIDLDAKTDDDSFDISSLFSSWIFNQTEPSEININEDFRRKSFSTIQNIPLGEASVETEVREGFNFEEDVLIPDVKSSTKKNIIDGKRCPVVFLKPFNFNDIRQFEANNLSPLKNRKQSLLERWNKFHSKLNDSMLSDKSEVSKSKPQIKTSNIVKCVASKTYSRRSTRLNNLSVDSEGLDNTSHSKETHNASNIKEQNLLHNSSKKIEEKEEKKSEEPISSKFPVFDILSPRRSMRRSGQQAVDPLSVNTSKQIGNNKEDHPKVSPSKLQRVSLTKHKTENVSKNDIAAKRSFKLDNTTSDKMKNEGIIEEKRSEQILMRNIDVLNASQISSRISSKTSPVKKLSNQKDTDVHQNTDTSVRKSHRLKPKSDKISVNPSGTSRTLENATNMEVCSADSSLNETDANINTSIEEGVVISELDTKATVKKRRGRPPKAKVGLVGTSVLSEPLENGIANDKLRKHTKKDEEEISTELLVIRRSNNDEKDKGELKEGKNSDISKQGCFKMDDNNILLKNSNFLKLDSQSQNNGKDIQNKIKPINKIVLNGSNVSKNNDETTSIPCIQEPLKRKRGRPRKIIIGLKEPEPKSITESTDKEIKHSNSDILNDMNHETKTDKYSNIMNPQDEIRDNTDEAKRKEKQDSSTVLNHCEKKVVSQTNGISNKLLCKTSEPLGDVAENKYFDGISDEATEPCKEKKQKVSEESTENIENITDSLVKEKKTSEISIPEKPSDQENKSETKIKIDQKTEIKSDYLEQCNKSNTINYDSMNEKKEVDEAYSTSTKLLDKSESIVQPPNDTKTTERYFDFGYDIHRRTSFRKILERVMEASRLEMETMKSEELRTQRCKSVPHEEFHCGREASDIYFKTFSADSKLKYLKDKKNANLNIKNVDFSKVRKRLDYHIVSKSQDSNFSMRKRTKSFHAAVVGSNDKAKYTDMETSFKPISNSIRQKEEIIKDKSLVVSAPSSSENVTKEIEQTNTDSICEKDRCEEKSRKNNSVSGQIISTNSEEKNLDQDDLEVENLLLGKISSDKFYERRRCKSFSEASHRNKVIPKSKSVMKKKLKKNKAADAVESPILNNIKKVHEFKVGDLVWGKIGNYPYWPGLVVEDPETSDFKKIRLLRTTPYYHVRFFGDKGKRAWTLHCIPYETADDLDVLREQSRAEGAQSSDFVVRASHKEKWRRAVKEAETVKNESVEKKLGFFDRILTTKEILEDRNHFESEDNPKESFKLVRSKSFSCLNKDMTNQFKTNKTIEKPKIPMKVSSLLACIENVVKNNSVESFEPGSTSSPPNKKSPLKQPSVTDCNEDKSDYSARDVKKTIRSSKDSPSKSPSRKRNISTKDSSVLPCIDDVVSCSQDPQCSSEDFDEGKTKQKSPDLEAVNNRKSVTNQNSPKAMTTNGTPVSRRKNSEAFFQRTRLRTGHLERRRLTQEFKQDEEESKASVESQCSPRRMKLKRRTIAVVQSNGMVDNVLLNDCVSRLSEHKKNIFRGVPKEKVCQICEKPGEVVKCRGPCNGDFHVKCIENSLKVTEECTLKEEIALKEKDGMSDNNKQVEISTIVSRKKFVDNVILSPVNNKVPMIEQFDRKMKELMNHVESRISIESSESSIEDLDADKNRSVQDKNGKKPKKSRGSFKHVTADDVREINLFDSEISKSKAEISEQMMYADEVYKCPYCTSTVIPPCFVCNSIVSKKGSTMRQRCSLQKCGRYYHLECLNVWHQTQWSFILHDKRKTEAFDSFVCPRHSCHICASENSGFSMGRCPNDKLVKCLRCPATYHNSYHCVPAGTDILSSTQIICPRHVEGNKKSNTLNTIWCFVCSEGGNLICCETCPTSVHAECLPVNLLEDDTYICEDCESGRFPLYDEVVWVKCGTFRWWPAIILFPNAVPANVESKPHSKGEFVVKFFGTYNYFWVGRGRAFLYQEGDTGVLNNTKNKIDEAFSRALKEAADVYRFKKGLRAKKQKEVNNGLKPPSYVRIKVNRPVGNVKVFEGNLSNTTPCECDPKDKSPCGPNSSCLNRILLTECNPEICPAGQRCKNQSFEKREYPQVIPYRTTGRGWGLKTLEPIKKGRFVIEYVGEIIDDEEYQRRITRMHQQKDENYYFLTIDKDRMLDAGPKGNVARFMNHSCQPNCETQKWTVNGDTRVGLFAIEDIPADSELTFNYNLECVGTEKKICRCGAPNCSGFIGVKPEDQKPLKKNSSVKSVEPEKPDDAIIKDSCFVCGKGGDVGRCSNKTCFRSYHLECVQLDSWPNGKWNCPSHSCNICSKRTSRICVLCNNSYCPFHSNGNIRHDDSLGFLCSEHDQVNKRTRRSNRTFTGSDTPQKEGVIEGETSESLRSKRYRKRTSETNEPTKRLKLDK